jgi:hypothetical protein
MKDWIGKASVIAATLLALCACSGSEDLLGKDPGRVRLSCAGSQTLAGVPPLKDSLSPLSPGTKLEILKPAPEDPVQLMLPEGRKGDEFSYAWKEASVGAGRPPGAWLCRAGWQYDGDAWQLSHLDAQWIGGVTD